MKMWGVKTIYRYVGSILPRSKNPDNLNETFVPPPPPVNPSSNDNSETYTMIVIFLSTLLPLMCVVLSALIARKLWVKFHDQGTTLVEREDTGQTSVKSARESGSRKSSRAGSRVSKSEPSSRDQLLPQLLEEELERRPSLLSSRRRSSNYFVFQDMDEEPSYENRSYVNSPILPQEATIDNALDDPIIVVAGEDDAVASTSQERMANSTAINIEDDGGFGGAKSKFRHSLKVDVEGSPHKTSHHRSYSDAGRNRKKPEHHSESVKETEKSSKSSNLLAAPGTKIRKSHSMRYRSDGSPTGTRPRSQAQDDCMGNLKRTALEPEIMVTSPRLQSRRSPHHFYQQQHQPQVHQQPHSSHHQHHYKIHHRQEGQEPQIDQLGNDIGVPPEPPPEGEAADSANFVGMSTSDLNMEENGTSNSSYKYGSQPPNKYPPLNKVMYYGGYYGYPATTSAGYDTSTDTRPRRLHVSSHQGSGASPTEEDENKELIDRKKSLPNALDFPPPEIRPMPVLSPRGLLSKQFSLPAGARNSSRQLKGGHQRHHASLRHDPAPQRLLEAPTLTRRASARERSSSGGSGTSSSGAFLSARRTASGSGDRPLGRHSGSINLGSVSPRSPIPPNLGGSVSPRNHFSISRPGQSPSPHHAPDDEIQHI